MGVQDDVSNEDWDDANQDCRDDVSCAPGDGDPANSSTGVDDDLDIGWEEEEHTVAFMLDQSKNIQAVPPKPRRRIGRREALQCLLDDTELDELLLDAEPRQPRDRTLPRDTAYEDEVTDPKIAPTPKPVTVSIPVDLDERPTLSDWRHEDDDPGS